MDCCAGGHRTDPYDVQLIFCTCKYVYHYHHHHHHHHPNYLCQLILVKNVQLKDRFHVRCLGLNLKISHHCHVCNCWLVSYILCDLRDICMYVCVCVCVYIYIYIKLVVIIKPNAKQDSYNHSFLVLHFTKNLLSGSGMYCKDLLPCRISGPGWSVTVVGPISQVCACVMTSCRKLKHLILG